MKSTFFKVLVTLTIAFLIGGTESGADTSNKENNVDKGKGTEHETTKTSQEEKIRQLEAQIKAQQERIEQLQKQVPVPEDPVEKALRLSWNCCASRSVLVTDSLVRIYFGDIYDLIYFFDGGAIKASHDDLAVLLNTTGFKTGTIEYYSTPDKKLFSISGNLSDAKTKEYF